MPHHAGLDIQRGERAQLERLCRYVSRPPVASERLGLTPSGQVRYPLKTPYRDGVFAPHSRLRAAITPAGRGPGGKTAQKGKEPSATARPVAMSWAQRLKQRVFAIEIDRCARCQGRLLL